MSSELLLFDQSWCHQVHPPLSPPFDPAFHCFEKIWWLIIQFYTRIHSSFSLTHSHTHTLLSLSCTQTHFVALLLSIFTHFSTNLTRTYSPHTHMHTHPNAQAHTHMHTRTLMHTRTHMHKCSLYVSAPSLPSFWAYVKRDLACVCHKLAWS